LGSWCRGLTCLPVTEEIAGSNPVEPASNDFTAPQSRFIFLPSFCYHELVNIGYIVLLLGLLLPVSLDTFIMSAALGVAGLPKKQQIRTSLVLAGFEAGMPIVGVLIGVSLGGSLTRYAPYPAAAIIGLAGIFALWKMGDDDGEKRRLKLLSRTNGLAVVALGISVSVDELAVGVSLGLLHIPLLAAVIYIGVQSYFASQLGLKLGGRISNSMRDQAEKLGGIVLIGVAVSLVVFKLLGYGL
jgi:manganese efflux pump family protein